jgi:hypothetical protein
MVRYELDGDEGVGFMILCTKCGFQFTNESSYDIHPCVTPPQPSKENVMPEGQGHRDSRRPRYDLIPIEWKQMLAEIFEEGLPKYGDSWMQGGEDFLLDCINHAEHHMGLFIDNDYSEKQLEKVAWNCLCVAYHIRKNPELNKFFMNRKIKKGRE